MSIQIDSNNFQNQVIKLFNSWEKDEIWGGCEMLCMGLGKIDDDESPDQQISTCFFTWLIGYQFTETLIFFQKNPNIVHFLTSGKKAKMLKQITLKKKKFEIKIVEKTGPKFTHWVNLMKKAKRVGYTKEDVRFQFGTWIKSFFERLKELNDEGSIQLVDITPGIRKVQQTKLDYEVKLMKKSAKFTTLVLSKWVRKQIELIIKSEQTTTHSELSESTEKVIDEPKRIGLGKLDPLDVSPFYPLLVTSGTKVDFRSSDSGDEPISFSTINVYLGTFYKAYGTVVGRTYMINPSKFEEKDYNFLYSMYIYTLGLLKPGARIREDVFDVVMREVNEKRPDLERYFSKDLGFSCGIENQPEKTFLINEQNKGVIEPSMTIVVRISLVNVPEQDEKVKKMKDRSHYSLLIANTVLIEAKSAIGSSHDSSSASSSTNESKESIENQKHLKFLTGGALEFATVAYSLEDDEDDEESMENLDLDIKNILPSDSSGRSSRYRTRGNVNAAKKMASEAMRSSQQKAIFEKLAEEGKDWSVVNTEGEGNDGKEKYSFDKELSRGRIESYKSYLNFPRTKRNKIHVDTKHDSILLPINGCFTPFHVSTIRNVSKSNEAEGVYVRFNFQNPKTHKSKPYAPVDAHGESVFVKEMSFRSRDVRGVDYALKKIKELRRNVQDREKDITNRKQRVDQEKLILTRGSCPKLKGIHMRPTRKGRKSVGRLEAHENGFRFVSTTKRSMVPVEIIYENIKFAFYQPAKKEVIVLVHFHLHDPIVMGKKLQKDVQFYTEVMDEYEHLTGRFRRPQTDRESIREERREKELRRRLNQEFYNFCKEVREKVDLTFEIPYVDLEFDGTPFKTSSRLLPTDHCLVNLTETPFFVVGLDDVEIVVFERVSFGLRNFDCTFVMKDYSQPVVTVSIIPKVKLDMLRGWVTKRGMKYFESRVNLKWDGILKMIRAEGRNWRPWDPETGWKNFLTEENEELEGSDDEEEGGDDYVPEEESDDGYDSEEYEEQHVVEEKEEEGEEEEVDEENAPSWGDLHKEAYRSDKKRKRWEENDYATGPARKKRKFN